MNAGVARAVACSVALSSLFTSGALAQNFYELTQKKYCESVMESHRSKCIDLNSEKDRACKVEGTGTCDIDAHIKQIAEYKADVERLNAGQLADADRDTFRAKIEKTKAELDKRKNEAGVIERGARACVDARLAVYDFFDDDVIPATQRAGADAKARRDDLLEELDKAEVSQTFAKNKRDELAGADPEKDRTRYEEHVKMQGEYEKNTAAYREAEARLAEFNRAHGKDIDDLVKGLVTYYGEEQRKHSIEIEQQKDRSQNCAKVEYMSY